MARGEIEPFDARGALGRHVRETGAKFAVIFTTFVVCIAVPFFMGEGMHGLLFMSVPGLLIVLALWLGYGVWTPYVSWRRRRERHVGELYERHRQTHQEVEVTYMDRVRASVSGASGASLGLLAAGGIFGGWVMVFGKFLPGLLIVLGCLGYAAFTTLLIAALDARHGDGELADRARAEVAYREAVGGFSDLGGGLSTTTAADDGGLSVAADVGGLEASEEVALDLDGVNEGAVVIEHEEVSS